MWQERAQTTSKKTVTSSSEKCIFFKQIQRATFQLVSTDESYSSLFCAPKDEALKAVGRMLQAEKPVQLTTGQVLLEYRVLLRLPLPVCLGADDRFPGLAQPPGDPALRLAGHAGV